MLEKVRKDNEEKEAQLTKVPSVVIGSAKDKGKGLMEDHPQETIAQQMKTLMHTSQQFKQRLSMMNFVLDTQVDVVVHPIADIQIVVAVTQTFDDPPKENPFKRQKTQVSSSTVPTINLTNSDVE